VEVADTSKKNGKIFWHYADKENTVFCTKEIIRAKKQWIYNDQI
jgi:hypothetical protein